MYKLNKLAALGAVLVGLGLSGNAAALDGAELYKTKTCIACHGPGGDKPIMPTYPKLAGQNKQYLVQQTEAIMSGDRESPQTAAMKGALVTAEGDWRVTKEEIAAISDWLSKQ